MLHGDGWLALTCWLVGLPLMSRPIGADAVSSDMAKVTVQAQYPGYKFLNAPTQVR
ncbi:hypothetical protein VNPA110517_54060 [Pseudomonas aeruginosa]|nr:hypothetical protein VNPA110517_54060 [Pseudomonas aeruginosa]